MTRFCLAAGMVFLAIRNGFAIVPPIPPVIVLPGVPAAKPDEADAEADDVTKLADRIERVAKTVTGKLGERDTGEATLNDQKQLKRDLDKLIDLLQNQPPPPMSNDSSSMPPPSGGGGGSGKPPPPMGGPRRTGSGRGQREPMGGSKPMPMPMPMSGDAGQPMPGGTKPMDGKPEGAGQPMGGAKPEPQSGTESGTGGRAAPALPLAETIAKDFWGHLPEVPRQRMMQFFRERYNSRYKDLLPDYFSTLAEKDKKGNK